MSDQGGMVDAPFYTHVLQKAASIIGKIGEEQNSHFQISLGDNFYNTGVKSLQDERFNHTFENVFNHSHLRETPWFFVLGNRDYHGNTQAQIEYTHKSNRWYVKFTMILLMINDICIINKYASNASENFSFSLV